MNELVHDRRRFTAAATLVYSLYFVAFLALLELFPPLGPTLNRLSGANATMASSPGLGKCVGAS